MARPNAKTRGRRGRRDPLLNRFWKSLRQPLARSRYAKGGLASLLAQGLRLIRFTNRLAPGSSDLVRADAEISPGIIALWHGQHILAPCIYPRGKGLLAMVSRSADAELNALVVEKLGIEAVRGSGGRENPGRKSAKKGGAGALIALKKALDGGKNVAMIADIPHGTPREAGTGIVTLARLSGRPIVATAVATSRRKVLEKTWDKTTINLPFGRYAVIVGKPIYVDSDADDAEVERKRREVTDALNLATEQAYRLVDRAA